ncbi:MAG TPA: tetratricopeptide repeat protein [Moheibacter sp.]|nr:tetratricopeptide repeat protein [Moheibacter sp.]
MHYIKLNIFLILAALLTSSFSSAQIAENLDSLEKAMSVVKKNPDEIIHLGNLILSKTESGEQKSRVLGILAVVYFEKNDLNQSTELFFQAKDAAEKTGNHELIAKTYGSIAHQYIQLKLNDKAKFYLGKAIAQIEELPEGNNKNQLKGLSYLELGNVEFDNQNYKSANRNYRESLAHFQKMIEPGTKITYHYRRSLYNIGNSYIYLNQLDSAEYFLNQSLQIKDEENKELKFFIYNSLAGIYSQKEFYRRAIDSLEAVLGNKDFHDERLRFEVFQNLSQNYKKLGNDERYYFYNEKYTSSSKILCSKAV